MTDEDARMFLNTDWSHTNHRFAPMALRTLLTRAALTLCVPRPACWSVRPPFDHLPFCFN